MGRDGWMDVCAKENKASHVRVLGIGVELAMQWGIVRGNDIEKIVIYIGKDSPYQPQLQASSSPKPKVLP